MESGQQNHSGAASIMHGTEQMISLPERSFLAAFNQPEHRAGEAC